MSYSRGWRGDVVGAWRGVVRRPGFTAAVVLTLGLGIGANTAIFSVVDAILLSPLPYEDPDELYAVFERHTSGSRRLPSYPTFQDWGGRSDGLSGLAFARGARVACQAEGHAGFLLGSFVTEGFFDVMGVEADIGRVLTFEDHEPGAEGAVVLSHRAWERWFGSDPGILGSVLVAENGAYSVVGVMPPSFAYPDWGADNDLWIPISHLPPSERTALNQRGFHADSRVVARLADGATISQVRQTMDALAASLARAHPDVSAGWTSTALVPLEELETRDARTRLLMLWGAVALVLLMCCLNLASLYLVRGTSRRQEYAVRSALGAAGSRIFRQVATETMLHAVLGGLLGVLLATPAIEWVRSGGMGDLPRITEIELDATALAFAGLLSTATAVAFATISVRRAVGGSIDGTARATGPGSKWTTTMLSAIQATQVAMTFVLLLGAWLLGETFVKLVRVEPGYDPRNVLVVPVSPPSPAYDTEQAAVALYTRLMDGVRAVPGVGSVALTNHGPGGLTGAPTPLAVDGVPEGGDGDLSVYYRTVSAGYFAMLKTPVVAGREFTDTDMAGGEGPLIVNETLAARLGGPRAAVGRRIGVTKAASSRADFGESLRGSIVGVVTDLDPAERGGEAVSVVYVPFTHTPWAQMRMLVRATGDSEELIGAVEAAVRSVEPAIPLSGPFVSIRRLTDLRASGRSQERLNAGLVGAFAGLALVLACVGMYGVTSFIVTLRTREVGVRMALGAAPRRVAAAVVGHATVLGVIGVLGGVVTATALTSLITGLLYGVSPLEIERYVLVAAFLLLLVAAAASVPARRASGVDPARVLHAQ